MLLQIHCTFGPKMSQAGTLFWTFIIELSIVSSLDLSKQDPQLTEVPNRIPANVTLLNLARNEIAGINNTDLTNIDFLIQLDVSHNRLETFPSLSKFFDTLEILNLNHNNITDVPATSLQGFSSLQTLDLADNRLSQWPLLDVSHSSLTSLNLKGNKISEPNSNFPSNIQILDMSNNGIKLIPSTFYQNLPNLTHLTLSQNNIALFPDVTLLPELLAVVMDYNSLRELPDFSGISTKLEVITAKENAIVSLDHPLPNTLQTLDLYSNKITSISDSCFSETENITWINLAQNEIANFPMFKRNVTHLWHLTLNNNPLEEFNFDRLRSIQTGLTEFSINGNKLSVITYLPPTLEKLSLGYSEVYVEAEVWSTLTELKSLNIDHGVLKVFPDISALKSLVYLYCTESNIEAVNFDNFQHTHLSNIHLNRNRISSSLSYVPKTATYLRLDENYITHIAPDAFTNCIRLTHVYLSHNQLTGFPRLQTELPNLQTITIAHNQLTKFHFNDFATASHVDLAANQISAIHQDGFDLTQSTQTAITIHLGNNPLSTLPLPKLAASLQKVVIHAMGNPLVCDEHMAWIPRIQTRVSLLGTCVTPTSDTAQDVNSINWNAIKGEPLLH